MIDETGIDLDGGSVETMYERGERMLNEGFQQMEEDAKNEGKEEEERQIVKDAID